MSLGYTHRMRLSRIAAAALMLASCSDGSTVPPSAGKADAPAASIPAAGPSMGSPTSKLSPRDACALEAESPAEPFSRNGVATEFLNYVAAIQACGAAVAEAPRDSVAWFRLGRALEVGYTQDPSDEARNRMIDAYQRAADLDDPRAQLSLAHLFRSGGGDVTRAAQLEAKAEEGLRREAAAGSPQATLMLGHAMAAALIVDDDRLDYRSENNANVEAWKLIEQARARGADRLLFDLHHSLQTSGFCTPTRPDMLSRSNFNARNNYCMHIGAKLEFSREPVVAYEVAREGLRLLNNQLAEDDPTRTPDDIAGALSDLYRIMARFKNVADSGDIRVAERAGRLLVEAQKLDAELRQMHERATGSSPEQQAAAVAAILVGLFALAATARAAEGYTPPSNDGLFRQCVAVDSFGLAYGVPC